jgi:chaperonin GroES
MRTYADRVLVRVDEKPTESKGGLFIPETAEPENRVEFGTVLAVSDGILMPSGKYRPVAVKVGDKVMARFYGGTDVRVKGEDLQVFRENDILAIVED